MKDEEVEGKPSEARLEREDSECIHNLVDNDKVPIGNPPLISFDDLIMQLKFKRKHSTYLCGQSLFNCPQRYQGARNQMIDK